ncbi:restriction endonuclease subunit S [Exiguobacterium profundum]
MKKKGTPKIYFSRNIVLIETTFGEIIFSLRSGLSRMLSSDDIGLPVVRANNISHGNLDLNNDVKYWYQEDPQGANTNNYLIKKNDLLINFINSEKKMGTAALVKEEPKRATIYTTNILNLRTKSGIDPYYIFMITKTLKYKNYIKSITKPAVNQASFTTVDFKKFSLKLPSFEEQQKIGYFFKNLDDTISLHQQELEALKQTKKGFLQKMFPKIEDAVPEIRLKGFTDEWTLCELKNVATFINGRAYKQNELLDSGKYKVLRVGNFYTNTSWYYSDLELGEKYYANFGDLLYTWSASFGPHIWKGDKVIYHYHIWRVDLKDGFDKHFIVQLFEYDKAKIMSDKNGSTMVHITKKGMEEKIVRIPSYDEQIKIGEFFKQLDEVIELKEKELEALKETKKGFLQKMFV